MSSNMVSRLALGHTATIGTLYDARNDSFLPLSLAKPDMPASTITVTNIQKKAVDVSYVDSYKEKFDCMNVSTELGSSILAGLVHPRGSGHYLTEGRESGKILRAAIYHRISTIQERLNFTDGAMKGCLAITDFRNGEATHVVAGVEWGVRSVVTISHRVSDFSRIEEAKPHFKSEVDTFKKAVEGISTADVNGRPRVAGMIFEITAYSDILDENGIVFQDFEDAYDFLDIMPIHIKATAGRRGMPVVYSLIPVAALTWVLTIDVPDLVISPPNVDWLKKFIKVFDDLHKSELRLYDDQAYFNENKSYITAGHLQAVVQRLEDLRQARNRLKVNFAVLLQRVRSGIDAPEKLWELIQTLDFEDFSLEGVSSLSDSSRQTTEFIKMMVANGATYVGQSGVDLSAELSRHRRIDSYIFSFNDASRYDEDSWNGNQNLFLDLLTDKKRKKFVAIVDCDVSGKKLEKSHIAHFRDQQEISGDLLEERQFLAGKSFARYAEGSLEHKDIQKPVKRRFVRISCPGRDCDRNVVCDWLCSKCHAPIEYGYTDNYIYCDCGRSLYSGYEFKCKSNSHGPDFETQDDKTMLSLLKSLTPSGNLNILILGETGVGKSTFINAFVNYLTFNTLDESMMAPELNWVIPCAFSIHTMDRSRSDGKVTQVEIKVGSRKDERDGSRGESATQQTTVYPVTIGTKTYRLIDTPGIGDTRGIEYDQKNMADILSTLTNYDDLHGILILLKSNVTRLTPQFRFCIKELLTHLHRSAARNMAFGFTNTRISNYTPGDTFNLLNTLLEDHPDAGLELSVGKTYCFDSESFRFLAAHKNGTTMENIQDFRRSWENSRAEALRLLEHFKSQSPHQVRSTLSLNSTREVISQMTKPMAEISQMIKRNIGVSEDQVAEIRDTKLSGKKLEQRLHVRKVQLISKTLDQPRTVCTDSSCIDYKDDGNGQNNTVAVYKTHCHAICSLTDVKADQLAHPGLINCAAFMGSNFCNHCSHHWNQHMHVLYELEEKPGTVVDLEIQKQIKANASDVTLKETAIKALQKRIKEYESEHGEIQKAAAQFGIFLKTHSITPYNDATIAYLDYLIKEEKGKVQAGGNPKRLQSLEQDRAKHEETIKVLTLNIHRDPKCQPLTEGGVDKRVKELYNLKHFGKMLKDVQEGISAAHEATYREKPYRVKVDTRWHGGSHSSYPTYSGSRQGPSSMFQRATQVVRSMLDPLPASQPPRKTAPRLPAPQSPPPQVPGAFPVPIREAPQQLPPVLWNQTQQPISTPPRHQISAPPPSPQSYPPQQVDPYYGNSISHSHVSPTRQQYIPLPAYSENLGPSRQTAGNIQGNRDYRHHIPAKSSSKSKRFNIFSNQ